MKNKFVPIIISCAVIVVLIVAGVAYAINVSKNSDNGEVGIHLSDSGIKTTHIETDGTEGGRVASTVEIQLDDCAVAVGTLFKAIAIVTPADTERSVVWTSSNPDVIDVDSQGIITVKGVGVSVITATVGTVSDSVAIEGIQNASSGSQNGFGVYVAESFVSDRYGDLWTNHDMPNIDNDGEQYLNNQQGDLQYPNDTANNDEGNDNYNQPQDTPSDEDNSGEDFDGENNSPDDDTTQNSGSDNNTSSGGGDNSSTIGDKLDTQGFSQVMSNVYIYQENNTYYGEIVTQPNVTIIYIKKRGDNFDAQIQSVLANLVPEGYNQVWNNYLTANTDKTFMVDDRKVRIVVAPNGGHSQIVIYN